MKLNRTFVVKAELTRDDESGWLSFERNFKTLKEAEAAFDEATANPNCYRASITIIREMVR